MWVVIYKVIIYKAFDCLTLWLFVGSGAILGIGNRDKEKEEDKGHIMHYKLVVGVQVCLGQCVTKIRRQNDKDKETKWNKKYNIYVTQIYQNKIVNVWLVFLWDNKYNFYFISKSWENQLQYLIFFQKKRFKFNIYGCSCEFIWFFFSAYLRPL